MRHHILNMLVLLCVVLTAIGALISIKVGPVPYTLQNFGVILSGLILPPKYAFLTQILYLLLISLGLPIAAGFRGGLHVLLGYTAGYLWAFPISSYIMSRLSRLYLKLRNLSLDSVGRIDFLMLLLLSLVAIIPLYTLGAFVYTLYVVGLVKARIFLSNYIKYLIISTLLFLPQDLFMDHIIALVVARELAKTLRQRGIIL